MLSDTGFKFLCSNNFLPSFFISCLTEAESHWLSDWLELPVLVPPFFVLAIFK